jgi:hypothetical protein
VGLSSSASAVTITVLSESDILALMPSDTIGGGPADPPVIGNGVQGVGGMPFWADADGVPSDDDDPITPGDSFDVILGPATDHDSNNFPGIDIDALLVTVTFDVSGGMPLLPITLSEGGDSATLGTSDFYILSDLGFASGGGGDSFNPADNDRVGVLLITGADFNAGVHTDIGDFILSGAGLTIDYGELYRIDLFGVDQDYDGTSPAGGGEIVAGASNSAGGYLVPEPGSLVIIGGLLLGMARKRRTMSVRK